MKRSKRIELTENTIKTIAKLAIDKGTKFKPFVESILEKLANKHDKETTQRNPAR